MRKLEDFALPDGPICGVDEAGRGPVMGPLVVAGILVDDDRAIRNLGVKDSKKLTPARREALLSQITEISKFEIVTASASDIDALRQSMTMNVMESKMFATVIERLGAGVAYVDAADTDEELFGRYITKELKSQVKIISKHISCCVGSQHHCEDKARCHDSGNKAGARPGYRKRLPIRPENYQFSEEMVHGTWGDAAAHQEILEDRG
jgi:hypothetical protein